MQKTTVHTTKSGGWGGWVGWNLRRKIRDKSGKIENITRTTVRTYDMCSSNIQRTKAYRLHQARSTLDLAGGMRAEYRVDLYFLPTMCRY